MNLEERSPESSKPKRSSIRTIGAFSTSDQIADRVESWARSTSGVVVMLLAVQLISGLLLAFYYVPSADHAHTTVAYIEKVVPAGSWVRGLHHHGSQWLTFFLFVHLVRLCWRRSYNTEPVAWTSSVLLLALVLAGGATGYSLPWDARAFFSTRIAEGLAGGFPLLGNSLRTWLLGGNEISTLTISRFFALHALVTPALILLLSFTFLFFFARRPFEGGMEAQRETANLLSLQLARNCLAGMVVFVALAIYVRRSPAPLGPDANALPAVYLPRPAAQFLWLYQMLKYVPGSLGSVVALVLPLLALFILVALPFLKVKSPELTLKTRHRIATSLLVTIALLVITMTTASYIGDRRDPRTRQQLAKQIAEEAASRNEPFVPVALHTEDQTNSRSKPGGPIGLNQSAAGPPAAYTKFCATCHGEHGEGARQGPLKFPPLLGVSAKPRRTVDDIIGILNDPKAYGLEPPMRSFAAKLTDDEKRQIAEWVVMLKK